MQLLHPSALPDAFLDCAPQDLNRILGGPTLVRLKGRRDPPIFLTILQHGNEPVGLHAVQSLLNKYPKGALPRSIWLFVANVAAAEQGERVLSGQQDFNRVWPGTELPFCPGTNLMRHVVDIVTEKPLFLSIDLHNNTGHNPHYACINQLDPEYLQLANLFGRTAVFFRQPVGVQSLAMSEYCPATTIECGKPDDQSGFSHATEFIDSCLHMKRLPDHPPAKGDLVLLRTSATVKVRPDIDFDFDGSAKDLHFRSDLDRFNFGLLKKGEVIAKIAPGIAMPLTATLDNGQDIAQNLFVIEGGKLKAGQDIIPSMATIDAAIVRQDCLFYHMEDMEASSGLQN